MAAAGCEIAVVAVHGIGEQKKGTTLRQVFEPMVRFFSRAAEARRGESGTFNEFEIEEVCTLTDEAPNHAVVRLGDGDRSARVLLIESRWSDAFRPAKYSEMNGWMVATAWHRLWRLIASAWRGVRLSDRSIESFRTGVQTRIESIGSSVAQNVAAAATAVARKAFDGYEYLFTTIRVVLYIGFVLAATLLSIAFFGVPVAIILLVLGAVVKATRGTTTKLRSGLAASIGDEFTFQRKPLDRAAMVEQVRDDLRWVRQHDIQSIVIVAHSLGSAVVFEALQDVESRARVVALFTVGNALEISGVVPRPKLTEAPTVPSFENIAWTDYYTSFDAVPIGSLQFSDARDKSVRVSNQQSFLRDHTSYFENAEDVTAQIAETILTRAGIRTTAPQAAESSLSARVAEGPYLRQDRKSGQSAGTVIFCIAAVAAALGTSGDLLKTVGGRLYDITNSVLSPLPDSVETHVKSWLTSDSGEQWLGTIVVIVALAIIYRVTFVFAMNHWDTVAFDNLVSTKGRMYRPAHLLHLVACLVPCVGVGVACALRFSDEWMESWPFFLCVALGGLALLAALPTLVAVDATLASNDLEPRGWLYSLQRRLEPAQPALT